ncbi:UNVERIFIED_CONTAM: hypothetical protein PYX00_004605 [Menopon gallinae]|uniref:Uncharacterized protein n=1 Tax=Menopon gallinae TaxID=328185 RepID=A0AAW2I6E4_9NEOP
MSLNKCSSIASDHTFDYSRRTFQHSQCPKVILSFLLLMVLQSVLTEGEDPSKPSRGTVAICPNGMIEDINGKCVPAFELVETRGRGECPNTWGKTADGKCLQPL